MKRSGIIFALVGPAGSGKTTLADELLRAFPGNLTRSISMTSRHMRPGEKNGESRYFVSRAEFEAHIKAGDLLEYEEVHGQLYGQLKSTFSSAVEQGADLLFDIDIKGARTIKEHFQGAAVVVFIVPPSFAVLKERLLGRGAIDNPEFERRLATARQEYDLVLSKQVKVDYLVVNDNFQESVSQLAAIIRAERARFKRLSEEQVRDLCKTS